MTTKNITEQIEKLEKLVPRYFAINEESKAIKKDVTKDSTDIKDILTSISMDSIDVGDFRVSLSHIDKSYMDTDKLLAFVKAEFPTELQERVIKTREYIDEDVLESIMYKNEISDEIKASMAKCMVEKEELRLNIRKLKASEKEDNGNDN